jgi:hypothetical protein
MIYENSEKFIYFAARLVVPSIMYSPQPLVVFQKRAASIAL